MRTSTKFHLNTPQFKKDANGDGDFWQSLPLFDREKAKK